MNYVKRIVLMGRVLGALEEEVNLVVDKTMLLALLKGTDEGFPPLLGALDQLVISKSAGSRCYLLPGSREHLGRICPDDQVCYTKIFRAAAPEKSIKSSALAWAGEIEERFHAAVRTKAATRKFLRIEL